MNGLSTQYYDKEDMKVFRALSTTSDTEVLTSSERVTSDRGTAARPRALGDQANREEQSLG